jgi:hypothetical protein
MTVNELIEVLDTVTDALKINREVVTPEFLDKVRDFIVNNRYDETILTIVSVTFNLTNEEVQVYFSSALKIVTFEEKLVMTDLTDKIQGAIVGLKNRPLILKMLAALI